MAEPITSRTSSDRPFLIGLAILGGTYIILIVGMLGADLLYLVVHKQIKMSTIEFLWDDAGRLLHHGDNVTTQYDRRGLTIQTHSEQHPATIFEYLPVENEALESSPAPRFSTPMLGIAKTNSAADMPSVFQGPQAKLVFQWAEPVEFTLLELSGIPVNTVASARFLDVDGQLVASREIQGGTNDIMLELSGKDTRQSGIQNVSGLELALPRGGFVSRIKYLWLGRARADWETDYPLLSRLAYNPLTDALRKPEIRYATKLSLISCTITAILSLWVAIPIGYLLSRYQFRGHNLIDAIVDIPIVLPPLVVGLSLLILFQFVPRGLHDRVVYEIPAVVLAQTMVAAAFAVRTMRATFDQIDSRREEVALTLGCTRFQAFTRVVLPEARRGILTAATLAWARALGEFGPLLIFAGATRMKTEVLSTTIFLEMNVGDTAAAVAVSLIMVTGAMIVLIIARLWGNRATI
ncbi:MAG: ABC transporter permease [Planctomycetota bacterium]|nr:ABC transporter permease [Planctomycetota bacterium]